MQAQRKSEIVSTAYPAPYDQYQQSIVDFIRKTQADYLSKIIRVSFLVPNSLNPNETQVDEDAFNATYAIIQAVANYCNDNGMVFEEPKFYNDDKLKVIIYDDKKYKKEQEKKNQGRLANMFDKLIEKISPIDATQQTNATANTNDTNQPTGTDAPQPNGATPNSKHADSGYSDGGDSDGGYADKTGKDTSSSDAKPNDSNLHTQANSRQPNNQPNNQFNNGGQTTRTARFDEALSECIKIQIEEISSRLIAFNKTAEEAGIRSVCKLKTISITPIDQDDSTKVDTVEQLSNFLTFYAGDKRKVIYLKQVMERISPILVNYFNADEVIIEPHIEDEQTAATPVNPFATLMNNTNTTETNTKVIGDRWKVSLIVSYFDQDIDAMSSVFRDGKLSEADVLNLDMQLSIQDHLYHGKNARVITAPSYDFTIGRSDDADVQIFGDEVAVAGKPKFSREHLRVQKNGNQWMMTCISHNSPVMIDGTEVMRTNDSKVIKRTISARLGTAKGIGTGEYGIYPEITFNVASRSFTVEITDPGALEQSV